MKVKTETIVRTIVTAAALINSVLTLIGKNPLPWSEDELYTGVSATAAVITTAWSWWKNNSLTHEAIEADEYMHKLKEGNLNE